MSSTERWQRVGTILEAAFQARPEERASLLDRLCGDDAELRGEVESFLAASARHDDFLETSAEALAASYLSRVASEPSGTDTAGAVVGRHRLIEEIGRGGMGTVWLAERADGQFEQRVALKLVKRGMDSDEIVARFLRERQILARLEHPSIARLLDGGVSDDGRPYFVMEHVTGMPITDHCDQRGLSIDERLRLFCVACRAVQHAHRNLVVHRDLKPSNVLVTGAGEVRLLDFGIARLLTSDDMGATLSGGIQVMTPEYASPEQVAGEAVTTASDVYQLGVLLYELLSGHRTHTTAGRSPAEIRRSVLEASPQRPSTVIRRTTTIVHRDGSTETIEPGIVGARRAASVEQLRRRLHGDLDTITMAALRKEPERRYPSAEALAEDIERHLADLPIRFGGDRVSYRAVKFARRHRLGVTTGAGVLALTIGLLAFDMARVRGERDLARLEAAKAAENAQLMSRFFQSWNPDAADRGEISAEAVLRESGRRAERELRNQPETLAATLSLLGDMERNLGQWRMADSLLTRALAIQERLYDEPNVDLAATLARRGELYAVRSEWAAAEASLRRALALYRKVLGPRRIETLRVQRQLGYVLRNIGNLREAEIQLREVLASIDDEDRASSPFALETASDLGYTLFLEARYDEAIALLRPTLERQQRIFGDRYGPSLFTMRAIGSALRDRGDLDEAESLYREALRIARAVYGDEHRETQIVLHVLSIALERKGELEEAERLERQSLVLAERTYGPDHFDVSNRLAALGGLRLERGDPVEAERLLRRALALLRHIAPSGHPEEGDILNRLAYIRIASGAADADELYREAVAFERARPAGSPSFVTDGIHYLAWAEHRKGDLAEAEADYRRALGLYRRQLPIGHAYRAAAAMGLGEVLRDQGRSAEAERYLQEGQARPSVHADRGERAPPQRGGAPHSGGPG